MSDETGTTDNGQEAEKGGQSGTYTPPASQGDLDRIIADRISRERAKYADYDDLKTKATKFAEYEEAQKSELQRANEARETAETALAAKDAEILRHTVAAKHGITGDLLDLLVGSDEAQLEARAKTIQSLTESKATKGAIGPYVPPEGSTQSPDALNGDPLLDSLKSKLGIT